MFSHRFSSRRGKSYVFGVALFVIACVGGSIVFQHTKQSARVVSQPFPADERQETLLTTAYRDTAKYEEIFRQVAIDVPTSTPARTFITSHHFLAAPLIARSYAAVSSPDITRIILVVPDHYQSNFSEGKNVFTTKSDWDALFGTLPADQTFINRMTEMLPTVASARTPFLREHGIYTEIPFLKRYFPRASIVPLIVKNSAEYDGFSSIGKTLRGLVDDPLKTLLVVSSDFSHDATHESAQIADKQSIDALSHIAEPSFDRIRNDCRSCVALMVGYLSIDSDVAFHLIENKDSTDFGGKNENVTSYVTGYYAADQVSGKQVDVSDIPDRATISILFGGDMSFDRYIRTVMRRHGDGFMLEPLQKILKTADVVVANLEGPITESASVSETSAFGVRENYIFTFPKETAALLKESNIGIVSLGNNHILNFKESGVESTKQYLAEAGVGQFGSPLSGDNRVLVRDLGGVKIGFVNYNQFIYQGKEKALEDIAQARKEADIIIVYAHWGKEYEPVLLEVRELAHRFIDAGADALIGSHPHIVQEKEVYSGKTIYYSLGNFVFDQYFEEGTMHGLLVKMNIDPETKALSFEDIPIALQTNGQTVVEK